MSDRVSVSNEGWQTTDTTILRHQLNLADSIFYRYPDSARNLLIRSGTNSARIRYTIGLVRAYSLLGKY